MDENILQRKTEMLIVKYLYIAKSSVYSAMKYLLASEFYILFSTEFDIMYKHTTIIQDYTNFGGGAMFIYFINHTYRAVWSCDKSLHLPHRRSWD